MLGVLPADPAGLRRQHREVAAGAEGGWVDLHHLQVVGQFGRGQRRAVGHARRQGMAGADHGDHLHRGQGLHGDARMAEMLAGDDAQLMAAVQQRGDGAAQRQHRDARGHGRIGDAQAVQRGANLGNGVQGVHHERQFQLHPFAQPLGAGAHGVHPQQDVARVGQQRLAFRCHDGPVAAAVEQLHAQLRFHVGDGVADGRLHSRQLLGRGAETAGVGHGGEHA
ncbi:Uncharacterised protein [Achromobacter xylosoxidans]|nr:Uncharacterised protein [Achromobacter xylosoxidans]CUJ72182.1 Uncharacterised protein [Achromobacter xylosoxidans]